MAEGNNALVKRVDVSPDLSGQEQIKLLLKAKGFKTVAAWIRHRGLGETQVWLCISGRRPYPEIRDALAVDTGKPRAVIDQLIPLFSKPTQPRAEGVA